MIGETARMPLPLISTPTMKAQEMSEPISGAAAGAVGWKIIGGLAGLGAIGTALATIVVMSMTQPTSAREWRVALICTAVGSIGGGAAFIMHFQLQSWMYSFVGLMGIGGVIFTCGLPAWIIIRAFFAYADKNKAKGIDEMIRDAKGMM